MNFCLLSTILFVASNAFDRSVEKARGSGHWARLAVSKPPEWMPNPRPRFKMAQLNCRCSSVTMNPLHVLGNRCHSTPENSTIFGFSGRPWGGQFLYERVMSARQRPGWSIPFVTKFSKRPCISLLNTDSRKNRRDHQVLHLLAFP